MMKTIHPIGLATLIARHEPFDLIDVRTREEFHKGHIPGALSVPLPVLRRKWFPKVALDAPMVVLIAGLGLGLGLAVHEIFFLVPLALGFGALVMNIHWLARHQTPQEHAAEPRDSSPVEDWRVPHLSRLVARLGDKEVLSHPHHRVRFATPH